MMTNPATRFDTLEVQLLCLPEAILGTVFNAVDVLRLATNILKMRDPHAPNRLTWKVISPEGSPPMFDATLPGIFASAPVAAGAQIQAPAPACSVIVIPALYVSNALDMPVVAARYPAVLDLLKAHVAQGGMLAVCANGLIFPALLGMLDGMTLDTHWAFKPYFVRKFPTCDFSGTDTMSFHEPLFTCVAPDQQTDFMIAILHRLLDAEVSQGCARLLQLQPQRQQLGNRVFPQEWLSLTADSPVYRAKQWLESHIEEPYDLKALACVASSSERTLLRHFNTVLGLTPLAYLQDLRVQRAKVMLEITLTNMQTIAVACGYTDASTFGKLFQRSIGISPGAYRKQHSLRTKRVHWRVEPGT